jgi:hypothetical protein
MSSRSLPWRRDLGGELELLHHTTLAAVIVALAWPQNVGTMIHVLLVLAAVLAAELALFWPLALLAWGLGRACGSLEPQVRYGDFTRGLLRMSRGWGLMRS